MATLNVYAHEIQRGDYLYSPRERGGHVSGSSYVQAIRHDGDYVQLLLAAGMHDEWHRYLDTVPVWIDRD